MNRFTLIMLLLSLGVIGCDNTQRAKKQTSGSGDTTSSYFEDIQCCDSVFDEYSKKSVFQNCDTAPSFGSEGDLAKYMYKQYFEDTSLQMTFSFAFIIDENGRLSFPRIVNKKLSEYSGAEKKLLKALEDMPRWTPGKCDGKAVACLVYFPLIF